MKKKIGNDLENSNDYFIENIEFKNGYSNNKMILSTTISTETSNPFKTITSNFFKQKPKLNNNLIKNFHKDYLRVKFLNNKKSQKKNPEEKKKYKLINPKIIKFNSKRNIPIRLNLKYNSNNTSINNSFSKTKINFNFNKTDTRENSMNNINKTLSRINTIEKYSELFENKNEKKNISYFPKIRAENLFEFKDKIKSEIKGKYILSLRQEINNNFKLDLKNQIESYDNNISSVKYNKNLFNSYCETYDNYEKKLISNLLIEFEKNELLKIKINNLKSDIQRIKFQTLRKVNLLNEYFKIKCYLMSVKNNTKLIEKFPEEDLEELKYDKKLINFYMTNIEKKHNIRIRYSRKISDLIIPKRNDIRNETIFSFLDNSTKNIEKKSVSSSLINIDNTFIHQNKIMFKDINDFQEHFNNIIYNIMYSLNNYTEIRNNLNSEIIKLDKVIQEENTLIYKKNEINKKIEVLENEVNFHKIQYEEMMKYYNMLKLSFNEKKNNHSKLHNKICNIFYNFEIYINIDNIKKKELDDIKMLILIEILFNKIIQQNLIDRKCYLELYDKISKKIESKKKIEKNKESLKNQKYFLIQKLNKILEKSTKLIIKPRKKVGENLYLLFEKLKKKTKINKTFEHNDYELIEY